MERQQGKRTAPSSERGKRQEKDARKGGKAPIIAAVVLIAAAAGYGGFSYAVSSSGKLLPNTTISGVDVGGLTQNEAAQKLERELPGKLAQLSAGFTCGGQTFTVTGAEVSADADAALKDAAGHGAKGIGAGVRYLAALFGQGTDGDAAISFPQTPAAVTEAEAHITDPMVETTWSVEGSTLKLTKGTTGQAIDVAALEDALIGEFDEMLRKGETSAASFDVPVITEAPPDPDYDAMYQQVHTEPADAYLDKKTKQVVSSVTGVSFDPADAKAALAQTAEGEACSLSLSLTEPEITTAKLNANLFKDVLGQSSTKTAGGSSRWHNVGLACERVNGTILLPGETFSYNATVGPYSQAGGFQKAGAYVSGTTQDTWAGGVCQLSSTIYYTTLKADLKTVERTKHKYDVGYMPSGMDATVYGDSLDFKFQNDTDYPVKIAASLTQSGGKRWCNVTIYGTNTTGIHGEPYSVVVGTTAPKTVYEPNSSVPQGSKPQKDSTRTAYTGKVVEVHQRLVDASGKTVSDTVIHTDKFSARNAVYFYNPADAGRLGIDTSTGLMTKTPTAATPSPAASASAQPTATPAPSTHPAADPTAAPTHTPAPTPTAAPAPTPTATPAPAPAASTAPDTPVLPPEAQ